MRRNAWLFMGGKRPKVIIIEALSKEETPTPAQSVVDPTNSPVDLTNSPVGNTGIPVRLYYHDAMDDDVATTVTTLVTTQTVVTYIGALPVPNHVASSQARLLAANQPQSGSSSSSSAPVAAPAPAPTPLPVLAQAAAPVDTAPRVGKRTRVPPTIYPDAFTDPQRFPRNRL
ncbi:hypothetical protein B484DRAFT_405603 [Ochromonadaceae sp. CCMP2298]|nr:hypothetical protein B484DRAFT_405603 [Ochromonadaceae sp. CCMP2298]